MPASLAPGLAPSLDDIEALARATWDEMPAEFKSLAGDIVFRVEDVPDDATLDDMGIDDPLELTGLYSGVDLTQQSIADPRPVTPMVFLYRHTILYEWIARADVPLKELVSHVLVHEIGHHFGFSDAQMDAILEAADEG
ncbi:MAG: metallopeptidase family protein [Terricaulis sp.]